MVFLSVLNIKELVKRIQFFSPRRNGRKGAKRTNVLEEARKRIGADHRTVEAREGEALFLVQEDGKTWIWEHMMLKQEGASAYRLYIKGTMEGWEGEDTINCYIPNVLAKFYFLDLILQGKPYYFSSIAESKPLC